jgi:hypothetical protein
VTARPQTSLRRLVLRALAAGLSLAALIAIAAILTRSFNAIDAQLIATSLSFSLYTALGGAGVAPRRLTGPIRHLGTATISAAGADFALLMAILWGGTEVELWRAWAILLLVALAASHACLVLTSRRASDTPLILALTLTSIFATSLDAVLGALPIGGVTDHVDGNFVRLAAILVIVMLLTSLLPPILRRVPARERLHATGLPSSPMPASVAPQDDQAGDLRAIASRLEALAPRAGELAGSIAREAAHLRELAQSPWR